MLNKVLLIGNLGKDPEVATTTSGTTITKFSIATTERWNDKSGERQERTEWHNIVTFSRLAEICAQYLAKGKQVYIEGKIQTREWEDKDGNRRWTTEVIANEMKMLGNKGDDGGPRQRRKEPDRNPYPADSPGHADGIDDDDIPF